MKYTLLDTFLLDGYYVTQNYMNNPSYYAQFGLKGHEGVDFGHKNKLIKVRSPLSGTVFAGTDSAYGSYAVVEDYKQKCGIYVCHMINVEVVSGQEIKAGDVIGEMDDTGNSKGEHVHLNFIILDEKGSKKYNSKALNYGYLDPRYPRDTGVPFSFPGVEAYSIEWVQKIEGGTTTMPETIEVTKSDFETMRTKSDQVDALATYFKVDSKSFRAKTAIEPYERAIKDKDDANKALSGKQKILDEVESLLRTEKETSKTRKEQYDNLVEYLATNLGTPIDEAIVRGEFKELLSVEDKLKEANKTIDQIKQDHENEKKTLQEKIDKLNEDLDAKGDEIQVLKDQVQVIQGELEAIKETEKTISSFKKLLEDVAGFFIRLRDRFKQEEIKEKDAKSTKNKPK